jgi:hypothetical protein
VLSAVFDPVDARSSDGPWGFTAAEYAAMTRGQQAIFNLRWLRDFIEADTFLEYDEEPMLRAHADCLVNDAELVGPLPFVRRPEDGVTAMTGGPRCFPAVSISGRSTRTRPRSTATARSRRASSDAQALAGLEPATAAAVADALVAAEAGDPLAFRHPLIA